MAVGVALAVRRVGPARAGGGVDDSTYGEAGHAVGDAQTDRGTVALRRVVRGEPSVARHGSVRARPGRSQADPGRCYLRAG